MRRQQYRFSPRASRASPSVYSAWSRPRYASHLFPMTFPHVKQRTGIIIFTCGVNVRATTVIDIVRSEIHIIHGRLNRHSDLQFNYQNNTDQRRQQFCCNITPSLLSLIATKKGRNVHFCKKVLTNIGTDVVLEPKLWYSWVPSWNMIILR